VIALAQALSAGIEWAGVHEPEMRWSGDAEIAWCVFYDEVPDDGVGMIGALTARAEAHVLRLSARVMRIVDIAAWSDVRLDGPPMGTWS
jgi:hypothetical protein